MPKWQGLDSVQAAHQLLGWEYPCVLSPHQDTLPVQCSQEYTSSGQHPTTTTSHKDSEVPPKTIVSFFTCEAPGQPSGYSTPITTSKSTPLQAPPDQAQQQTQAQIRILFNPHPHPSSNLNPNSNSNQLQPQPKSNLNSDPNFYHNLTQF